MKYKLVALWILLFIKAALFFEFMVSRSFPLLLTSLTGAFLLVYFVFLTILTATQITKTDD